MMKNDICNCGAIALDENSKLVIDRVAKLPAICGRKIGRNVTAEIFLLTYMTTFFILQVPDSVCEMWLSRRLISAL